MKTHVEADRYVSFCGIECDLNARRFIQNLETCLERGLGEMRWRHYFRQKRTQQAQMGQDDLYFIGAQVNNLDTYLAGC